MGKETEIAQHPQIVLGNARIGIADKPDRSRGDILKPADKINDSAGLVRIQRIDGEIPPFGINLPVLAETHLGPPAIGLRVMPQCGDLEPAPVDHQRHRAMVNAGRHGANARRLGPRHHLLRFPGRGKVGIGHHLTHQRVAHRTTHHPNLFALVVEQRKNPAKCCVLEPAFVGHARFSAHA